MSNSIRYLEAAKIDELRDELTAKGYRVSTPSQRLPFDLIAEKPGSRLAYQVKAQASLRGSVDEIMSRRQMARAEGFDSLTLVVVNPPHASEVKVEGLEGALAAYFTTNLPQDLVAFAERWSEDGVGRGDWLPRWHGEKPDVRYTKIDVRQIDLGRLVVANEQIQVAGDGLIVGTVETEPRTNGQDSSRRPTEYEVDMPFKFDMVLDRALRVIKVNRVSVDTSSWDDEDAMQEAVLNSA